MNDEMLKDSHDERIEYKFNKIIKLQEKLENDINYIVTQDDIEFLELIEQDISNTIINSRNTKQLLNNDNANNNSTDSSNQDIKNDFNANLGENLDEEYNYDDTDEGNLDLLDRIRNAISFLTIKQKVIYDNEKKKEINKKIEKFQKLLEDMHNINDDYLTSLETIEKEMSTIDRNNITSDQLDEACDLLYYKAKNLDDLFYYYIIKHQNLINYLQMK